MPLAANSPNSAMLADPFRWPCAQHQGLKCRCTEQPQPVCQAPGCVSDDTCAHKVKRLCQEAEGQHQLCILVSEADSN